MGKGQFHTDDGNGTAVMLAFSGAVQHGPGKVRDEGFPVCVCRKAGKPFVDDAVVVADDGDGQVFLGFEIKVKGSLSQVCFL